MGSGTQNPHTTLCRELLIKAAKLLNQKKTPQFIHTMIYIFKNSRVFRKKEKKTTTGIFSHGGEGHRLSRRLSSMSVKGNGTTIGNHEICSIRVS